MTAVRPFRPYLFMIHKAAALLLALLFLVSAVMTGTLAWRDYSQHKTNAVTGIAPQNHIVLLNKFEIDVNGNKTTNPVKGAEFILFQINEDKTETRIGGSWFTDSRGQIIVSGLSPGEYYFLEANPGYGYTYDKDENGDIKKYPFTFDGEAVAIVNAFNRRLDASLIISKTVEGEQTDKAFEFTVTFSDGGSYPYTIDNGEPQTLQSGGKLYLTHGQKAIFGGLPVGIQYTVDETDCFAEGYVTTSTGSSGTIIEEGCTAAFTNTEQGTFPEYGSLTVTKTVAGEGADKNKEFTFNVTFGNLPEEPVTVLVDGKEVQLSTVNCELSIQLKHGEAAFIENIPAGTTYSVVEDNYFSECYAGTITGGSGHIAAESTTAAQTNTYIGTVYIDISGEKSWDMSADPDAPKPGSITVHLKNGDTIVKTAIVMPDKNKEWKYTLKASKYDEKGEEIEYTVEEESVPGYISKVNGFDIKNTRIAPAVYEPVIQKTIAGDKPAAAAQFSFKLAAVDGAPMPNGDMVSVTGEGEKKFGEIKYRNAGTYTYTITEVKGSEKGYTYDESVYTLTVIVEEISDNLVVKSAEYLKPDDITKYDMAGFINTYAEEKPGTTSVKVTKKWIGNDPNRPQSVQIQLYKDDAAYGKPVTLNSANNWTHIWTQLDENAVWTVDEPNVPERYTKKITGSAKDGFTVTNVFDGDEPPPLTGKITVSGTKTWNHGSLDPKYYPKSITVLVKDGDKIVVQRQVTASDHWSWSFTLNKYDENGREIVYTVGEVKVGGYRKQVNGYDIINTFDPNDPDRPDKPGDPGGHGDPDGPKTGDDSSIWLWITLMILSLISLTALFIAGRKNRCKSKHISKRN